VSSDRPPNGKREWTNLIGVALTVITTGAAIVLRFGALEEAKAIAIKNLQDHEARISALERSSALLERIHNLELLNAAIRTEVEAMREELRELRNRRR
jgi:hypothetical protein